MCMYEWVLLAQVSLIRFVYHPSDNASYFYSGQQVGASLVNTYIIYSSTYIHTCALTTQYLYTLFTIQGRYLFGRHCRCGQQRYICSGLSGFYAFESVCMHICISVSDYVCVFACLLKVCKLVSLPKSRLTSATVRAQPYLPWTGI